MKRLPGKYFKAVVHKLLVLRKSGALKDHMATISFITKKGMFNILEMNPDLVRTAGFQLAIHQGHITKPIQHSVMGDGMASLASIRVNREYLPVARTAADMTGNRPFIGPEISPYQRQVMAVDGMVEKLGSKPGLGKLILGGDHDAAGILIDPVHQERRPAWRLVRRNLLQMVCQCID